MYYEGKKISHYRIDRIKNIEVLAQNRKLIYEIIGKYEEFNVAEYMSKIAGMSSGDEQLVKLRVKKDYLGKIHDKFGENVRISKTDNDWNELRIRAITNKEFIRWLLSFGNSLEVMFPVEIRERLKKEITGMKKIYGLE